MGGDNFRCFASEDESSLDNEYPVYSYHPPTLYRDEDESISGSNEFVFEEVGHQKLTKSVEFDGNLRRRKSAYREIMKSYDQLWVRRDSLYQAKSTILSYSPGSWISNAGGKKRSNYVIPKTTTLLIIGPRGSGKSSLVNRISKVFEDDKFASERAQVTYNSSSDEGTYFLQEYMIPRSSTSFCLFDTRSLSENFADNDEMLHRWMTKGVCHGDLIVRDSDSSSLKRALQYKARQSGSPSSEVRTVNFVIFVVNGFSVLRAMNSDNKEDRRYMEMVTKNFSCQYLSFKDDKPAIIVTHGDLLSLGDRARVRVYLGEKLGVPPAKQIFDILENNDPSTELTIVDMIRYSLEHADKNLPLKESREWLDGSILSKDINYKVFRTLTLAFIFLAILLGIACFAFPTRQSYKHDEPLTASTNWHAKTQVNQAYQYHETLMTVSSSSPSNSAEKGHSKCKVNQPHEPRGILTEVPSNSPSKAAEDGHSIYQVNQPYQAHEALVEVPQVPSNAPSKSAVNDSHQKQGLEHEEPQDTSEQTLPPESVIATAAPTVPSASVVHRPCRKDESRFRSSSPDMRHPKSAVKWHKIRHLWLDSD